MSRQSFPWLGTPASRRFSPAAMPHAAGICLFSELEVFSSVTQMVRPV